jgi:hypothetical protein
MLNEIVDRDKLPKRIAVSTGSEAFTAVLESLLGVWGVELCRRDDPSALLLAEEGCCELVASQKAIWLSRSDAAGPDRIRLPVSLEALWQIIEQKFHRPTRMHLRMALDFSARVFLRGEWYDTILSSMSDMGARFTTEMETVREEKVILELIVNGEVRQHHGEIIFSMALGSLETGAFQSGVVFVGQDKETCNTLRYLLIRWCLEAVREGMDRQVFQDGLAFLDLAPEVVGALAAAD